MGNGSPCPAPPNPLEQFSCGQGNWALAALLVGVITAPLQALVGHSVDQPNHWTRGPYDTTAPFDALPLGSSMDGPSKTLAGPVHRPDATSIAGPSEQLRRLIRVHEEDSVKIGAAIVHQAATRGGEPLSAVQ